MALSDNLVAYYKCNDNAANTTVTDTIGTYGGTASTNTSNLSVAGKIGQAFDFVSASSERVALAAGAFNFDRTQAFSVGMWVKFTTNNNQAWIGNIGNLSHNTDGWVIMCANGIPYLQVNNGAGYGLNELQIQPNTAYNDGNWHHLVVTADGTGTAAGVRFYKNGSVINPAGYVIDVDNLAGSLTYATVGCIAGCNNAGNYADVDLDEIAVWSRAITADEVTTLYGGGSGYEIPLGPDFTKLQINISDVWKACAGMQIQIGGNWKQVAGLKVNISDSWKTIF